MSASWWILNHEQKSPLSSEPCNDTNCHSYSPLLYFYSEIWASEREHWNMKQKWDWHSGKQRTEHGVHCKKQRPWTGVEKVSAHFHWSGKGQMWFLTVVAFTPPPSTSTFPLLQRYCLHSVICLDSLCKWLPRSCNPNVHFFFMDFPSTKLNVNFIPYFIFQTPQHFVCYFLYKWARFPLNRVLSYHGYVTGACGYQWRHSQA